MPVADSPEVKKQMAEMMTGRFFAIEFIRPELHKYSFFKAS